MAAHQAPLPVGFSRQEYWSGLPLPSPIMSRILLLFSEHLSVYCMLSFVSSLVLDINYMTHFIFVRVFTQFSSVQSLSRVWLFATPWIAARQASLSITNSRSLLKCMSIDRWCHPAISSSLVPFSCPQCLYYLFPVLTVFFCLLVTHHVHYGEQQVILRVR